MADDRQDGLVNVATGVGNANAKNKASQWKALGSLFEGAQRELFDNAYESSGLLRTLLEYYSAKVIRPWVKINGEGGDEILQFWETLRVKSTIIEAQRRAMLYGGSGVVMVLEDGKELNQPIGNPRKILELRVYDRFSVQPLRLYGDPKKAKFGQPESYTIYPIDGSSYEVHESKILIFQGLWLPEYKRKKRNGWSGSVLDWMYQSATAYESVMLNTREIMEDFINTIMKVKDLGKLLASEEGETQLKKRADIVNYTKGVAKIIYLDSDGEDYTKQTSTVTGIGEVIDRYMNWVSACSGGIPVSLLFGRSAAGMNATGEGDETNWYELAGSIQEDRIDPQLERLVEVTKICTEYKLPVADDWSIEWNPMKPSNLKQESEVRKLIADIDKINYELGILDSDELKQMRFPNGQYTTSMNINED
jgi:uncharacterized protein